MKKSVKNGILIFTVLLIASLIASWYFYIATPKGYFADTGDEIVYSETSNDYFNKGQLPLAETLRDDKSPPPINSSSTSSDKKPPLSSTASTERFGDDKTSNDNILSSKSSTTPSVSNKQFDNDKLPHIHGSSQEPVVEEKNNTIKDDSLPQSIIDHIKTFVFFLGYPRSGHSIVGSLMDSHPHMVISHEFDLFTKLSDKSLTPNKSAIFNALWKNTKQTITSGCREKSTNDKGYTLFIDGLYQGRYVDHIDVIGDKKGGTTADLLAYHDQSWVQSFNILKSLNLPMKVVHVLRNPYDNIATIILYIALLGTKQQFGDFKKLNRTLKVRSILVDNQIGYYFAMHKAILDAKTTYNLDMIEIHSKDFISDPKGILSKICSSLGVICYDDYLEICNNKVYKYESRTRHLLEWTEKQLERIQKNIDKYADLKQYSFHSA